MIDPKPLSLHDLGAFLLLVAVLVGAWFMSTRGDEPPPEPAVAVDAPAPSGPKKKRKHNLPAGTVDNRALALLVVGDGLKLTRVGPEVKIPVGYGVTIVFPKGMALAGSKVGESIYVKVEAGAPYILLPVIGKLWPVGIIGMKLEGDLLTVELDGWTDYEVKIR